MKNFLLSEEGGAVEWLVGALIIGVGSIPIILGIVGAWNDTWEQTEARIKDIIWTGY